MYYLAFVRLSLPKFSLNRRLEKLSYECSHVSLNCWANSRATRWCIRAPLGCPEARFGCALEWIWKDRWFERGLEISRMLLRLRLGAEEKYTAFNLQIPFLAGPSHIYLQEFGSKSSLISHMFTISLKARNWSIHVWWKAGSGFCGSLSKL